VNDLAFSFDAAAQFLTLQKGGHIMVLEEVTSLCWQVSIIYVSLAVGFCLITC